MIQAISATFGVQPTKPDWSKEIKDAVAGRDRSEKARMPRTMYIYGVDVLVGRQICEWDLGDEIHLGLELDNNNPAYSGPSRQEYRLILHSAKLLRDHEQGVKQHNEELAEKARAVNAKPKF